MPAATAPPSSPTPQQTPSPAATASALPPTSPPRRGLRVERIGVSIDYFSDSSRLSGEQWINSFRADESFDYGAKPLGLGLYVLFAPSERWRLGPGLRFLGNQGTRDFTFGYVSELSLLGEYSLPAFERFDAIFGGRAGMSVLFPGEELSEEIRRLRAQRVGVWNVPRLGWVGGLNIGLRRLVAGQLYGRLDLTGQLARQWVFATDHVVDGLRFQKSWSLHSRRIGVTLAAEVMF